MVDKKIGAILTVGGGIGGVQASLDLAESGFKVYLVEEKPCIGGVMAQLDKTFPTNDCSACIFSPKLQTLSQNPNIEILAYSRIEAIEGVIAVRAGCNNCLYPGFLPTCDIYFRTPGEVLAIAHIVSSAATAIFALTHYADIHSGTAQES